MIIKQIKSTEKYNIRALDQYMRDAKKEGHGPKCDPAYSGGLGFVSEDRAGQIDEMKALVGSYKENGNAVQHWVMSWEEGEKPTPAQVKQAWEIFLKHQGCEGHQLTYDFHTDKKNLHSHACFNRINPDPAPGQDFQIVWDKGTVTSVGKNGERHVNQTECKHVAMAEICAVQGWKPTGEARYTWKDGQYIRNHYESKPDQIKLGQRIEAWEARNNVKHPKRLLAETALAVIRAHGTDKAAAVTALAAQGIHYSDVNYLDNKGRRHCGGKLTGIGGEEVKISALPKDCRWIAKQPATTAQPPINTEKGTQIYEKIVTFSAAKKYIKQIVAESKSGTEMFQKLADKNLIFEQTGKVGGRIRFGKQVSDVIKLSECGTSFSQLQQKFNDFPPYAERLHDSQAKVNGNSGNFNGNGGQHAEKLHENTIAALARTIFETSRTTEEMRKALESQAITFTRETARDAKTGRTFVYGKLSRDGEAITLKALGQNDQGKAMFSLSGIDRVFLARDAAQVLSQAKTWKEAETTLANVGISYSRVKTTTAEGKEVIVGRLEKDGVTSNTGLAGKEFQPAALDARFLPYAEAKILYESARLEKNPVAFLAQKGLTASDIDRVGRVGEKIENSLKSQGKTKGKAPDRGPRGMDSPVIPRSIKQILDEIASAAMEAARLAQATAQANRATWEARKATAQAEAAEKALQDLKDSIKREPAPQAAAKVEKMSDTNGGAVHAPAEKKAHATPVAGMEKEKEQTRAADQAMREKELEKERQQRERERARARQRQ